MRWKKCGRLTPPMFQFRDHLNSIWRTPQSHQEGSHSHIYTVCLQCCLWDTPGYTREAEFLFGNCSRWLSWFLLKISILLRTLPLSSLSAVCSIQAQPGLYKTSLVSGIHGARTKWWLMDFIVLLVGLVAIVVCFLYPVDNTAYNCWYDCWGSSQQAKRNPAGNRRA